MNTRTQVAADEVDKRTRARITECGLDNVRDYAQVMHEVLDEDPALALRYSGGASTHYRKLHSTAQPLVPDDPGVEAEMDQAVRRQMAAMGTDDYQQALRVVLGSDRTLALRWLAWLELSGGAIRSNVPATTR